MYAYACKNQTVPMTYNFRPRCAKRFLAPGSPPYESTNMTAATSTISKTETQLRDILSRRIMILDGAMGTIIQQYKLDEAAYRGERFAAFAAPSGANAGHCPTSAARELFVKGNNELLTLTQPHVIQEIHERYLAAGAR